MAGLRPTSSVLLVTLLWRTHYVPVFQAEPVAGLDVAHHPGDSRLCCHSKLLQDNMDSTIAAFLAHLLMYMS
jgi:hypothetical protein